MYRIKRVLSFLFALSFVAAFCLSAAAAPPTESRISLPILMYHHISKQPARCGDYTVSPETLEGDLRYLRDQGYTSITLRELDAYAKGEGTLPEKPVMITFDDGQESFLAYGLPLFEQYDMHAVLAIIGACANAYTETSDHDIRYSYFSWPALKELAQSPYVELSAHTYDMHKLDKRAGCRINQGELLANYQSALTKDLEQLEARFETHVGMRPLAFAYPYGYYCTQARELLVARGYRILFTCNPAVNELRADASQLLSLGRFNRPDGMPRAVYFQKLGI